MKGQNFNATTSRITREGSVPRSTNAAVEVSQNQNSINFREFKAALFEASKIICQTTLDSH